MTLPDERYRAVLHTEQFLLQLCDPKQTPKMSKEIRQRAFSLLRHYPTSLDMELTSEKIPDVFAKDIRFDNYKRKKEHNE